MAELISLIVPCYNEEPSLPYFWEQTAAVMAKMDYLDFEVIFVNDGSKDKTLEVLRSLAEADSRVKYISFSRNFGKEAAMFAGLEHAKGDYAAVMDADLQDPLPCWSRCITPSPRRATIPPPPAGSHERGSPPSAPFSPGCSTGSSTKWRMWKLWTGPGTSG